jgi:hypothetical protein
VPVVGRDAQLHLDAALSPCYFFVAAIVIIIVVIF